MAYASNTDVVAEFKALSQNGGFTTTTGVTAAQVDEWCTRASNFIDSKIGGKYSVPVGSIASPNSFSLLKEICVWLVAGRVANVLNLQTGDAKTSSGTNKKTDFKSQAMDALDEIRSGKMKLNDGVLATSADGAQSYTNDNVDTTQPPTFTRGGDNW